MQFVDLAAQQERIREKIETNINAVLNHGRYIMGPEISVLEETLREYCGVKYAISCASGTDALLMALMAHNVGPGDAIFTTPFTFIATAEAIMKASTTLGASVPTFRTVVNANLRCSSHRSNVTASRKPPRNRKMIGSAYEAVTSLIEPVPISGRNTTGSKAVASSGMAPVSHQVAIHPARPATRHADSGKPPIGSSTNVAMSSSGPNARTMRWVIALGLLCGIGAWWSQR